MAVFKCKMCGGTLEINSNDSVAVCEYCGTKQTLPKLDDEKRLQLHDRANHFRRENEFDKAMGIYEMILSEDNEDCESYWGIVLCRYGIEYVEDPATHKRIPTVNRAQYTSIFDDKDYQNAIKHADGHQKDVYIEEAKVIDNIQKGILAISSKEEPFDVFICYKETDRSGNRTLDSVYAQDIYTSLTKEGYKVFFARITLEDKLGSAYEPYIFAALNSAKVMLVVGTEKDNFNAVWVKNEWNRYLALIKAGKDKTLIPVYKDISPYDMPEEFQYLQSQDMGKIGFMQDLIRGISKLVNVNKTEVKETFVVNNTNTDALLKRAFMFLEDGDFARADEFCEQVLNLEPECAEAYVGKLMSALRIKKRENLKDCSLPFDTRNEYEKAIRFADNKLRKELTGYIEHINVRNENDRVEDIYTRGKGMMSSAKTESKYKEAAKLLEEISGYLDSEALVEECYEKAEIARKDAILDDAKAKMERENVFSIETVKSILETLKPIWEFIKVFVESLFDNSIKKPSGETININEIIDEIKAKISGETVGKYESIIASLETISDWKDAGECITNCRVRIEEVKVNNELARIKRERTIEKIRTNAKKYAKIAAKVAIVVAVLVIVGVSITHAFRFIIIPNSSYNSAVALMDEGKYSDAIFVFESLDGYKDSETMIEKCETSILDGKYNDAIALMNEEKYSEAISAFEELDGYKDSAEKIEACRAVIAEGKYNEAVALIDNGDYKGAIGVLYEIKDYKDSAERRKTILEKITIRETVSAGLFHTVALKTDGTVVATGSDTYNRCDVSDWTDIVAISAGKNHTVGLKSDGTVVATGNNEAGKCNVGEWADIVAISAGYSHTVGLKSDGTVVAVGDNEYGQCDVSGWTGIVAVFAGEYYTVGLKYDGTVVAVGDNDEGQCNVSEWTDIVAVSVGNNHTVGLKSDGTVVATGNNEVDECNVGEWADIVAVSAGTSHTVGLKSDGTAVAVGSNYDVSGWTDIVAISSGNSHIVGLKSDGTVVTVGSNNYGQCDVSSWTDIVVTTKSDK